MQVAGLVCNKCPVQDTSSVGSLPQKLSLPGKWNHLMFHVSTFAEQELPVEQRKFVAFESAVKAMKEAGLSFADSFKTALGVTLALPAKTGGKDHKIDIYNITKAEHPLDSRIFDQQGNFDHVQFEAVMLGFGVEHDGGRVITETSLKRMHEAFKTRDTPSTNCLQRLIAVPTSNGEFGGLFNVLADEKITVDGKEERFIREDLFRSFYEDGPFVFEVAKYYQKINKAQTVNQIYKAAVVASAA